VNQYQNLTTLTFFRGRVALFAILRGLGIGSGDEVAIPAYTCVAVPEAVLATGAVPVFFDLEPEALTSDPRHCEAVLTSRTRAIVVQHTFGMPADMERFSELARRRGLPLIEDCCHTYRSTWAGRTVGSFGDAAFYSFEWGKPIVAGLGGAAVCANPGLWSRIEGVHASLEEPPFARDLRISCQYYGFALMYRPSLYWAARRLKNALVSARLAEDNYTGEYGGEASSDFRYRMASSCRVRLLRRIRDLDAVTSHSQLVSGRFRTLIRADGIHHFASAPDASPVYARYPLRTERKADVLRLAESVRVELAGWYDTPIHPLTAPEWKDVGYSAGACPNAERAAREVVTLPTHRKVSERDIDRTVSFFDGLAL
jgi:perosamine synthetase